MGYRRQFSGFALMFAIGLIPLAKGADEATLAPVSAALAQGRAFLLAGRVPDAERSIRAALAGTADDAVWSLAGEISLRQGDFPAARKAFEQASALNPGNSRSWWGLGRIEQLHSRRDAARDLFARAYQLDPRDPDILLAHLDGVTEPSARAELLRNVVALTRDRQPERAQLALGRLAMESRLAGRMTDALASPYVAYKLPLTGFRPEGVAQHGLIITARINGGHPLRLVLDTGARGILLYKSAARDLKLEPLVASQVGGLGAGQVVGSTLSLAKTIAFGDLQFRDCLVHVSNRDISPEADGVLAPSLFEQFLVRIDPKAKAIQLSPRIEMETPEAHRALNLDKLLLVRGEMACDREGWFLLDTGAAFTAMGASTIAQGARTAVDMVGAQGSAGAFRVAPIAVKVGGRSLTDPEAIALDLAGLSQREGVEIAGILGYSALSRWPVTIDYRSGLVRIGDPK